MSGTIRYLHPEVSTLIGARVNEICTGMAVSHGVDITVDIRNVFDVLINDRELSQSCCDAAAEIVGLENAAISDELALGSEDFADMLHVVPGAYFTLGHSGSVPVHNPMFTVDDDILPVGARIFAKIIEKRLA